MITQTGPASPARTLFDPIVDRYETPDQGDYAMVLKTYRYLRLSMVIVMVALGASVLLVRREHTYFEQSISAYYYTPTRSVFVGALVATGIALTVIKGRTTAEDWLLSVAGVFAPVVAFVPTTSLNSPTLSSDALAAAHNNLGALLVAGWVAWVVVAAVTAFTRDDVTRSPSASEWSKWPSVAGMLVLLVAATSAFWWWPSFPKYAHGWSAAAMFAALGLAALVNGLSRPVASKARSTYGPSYLAVGVVMLVVGIGYMATSLTHHQWSYEVLEVEAVEITLFVVFWIIQSVERWNWTVSPSGSPSPPAGPSPLDEPPPSDGPPPGDSLAAGPQDGARQPSPVRRSTRDDLA